MLVAFVDEGYVFWLFNSEGFGEGLAIQGKTFNPLEKDFPLL